MKVRPYIKRKPLRADELRIISVDKDAIAELLAENLMSNISSYFDVPDPVFSDSFDVSKETICLTKWDPEHNFLIYAIMPLKYSLDGYDLNPDFLQELGITTKTLFTNNYSPKMYKSFTLTEDILIKASKTGDGSLS